MSEESKKDDVVKAEKYNEAIEKINSEKIAREKVETELKELKSKQEEEAKSKVENEKKSWEEEKAAKDKQISELTAKLETKDTTKVSKGIVSEPNSGEANTNADLIKKQLDEKFPTRKVKPEKFGSGMARFAHYSRPSTREYTKEQLGQALDLQSSAVLVAPDSVNKAARASKSDIKL